MDRGVVVFIVDVVNTGGSRHLARRFDDASPSASAATAALAAFEDEVATPAEEFVSIRTQWRWLKQRLLKLSAEERVDALYGPPSFLAVEASTFASGIAVAPLGSSLSLILEYSSRVRAFGGSPLVAMNKSG